MKTPETFRVMAVFDLSSEAGRRKILGLYRFLAEGYNWNLKLIRSAEQFTPKFLETTAHDVDGFLIAIPENLEMRQIHERIILPSVFVDYPDGNLLKKLSRCVFVYDDDRALGLAAIRHFRIQGRYKSYGCAEADNIRPWNRSRSKSFVSGMAVHGMKVNVFRDTDSRPTNEIVEWLCSLPKPAGILATFDDVARILLDACARAKLKVPTDIAILGIGNDPIICDHTTPPLSSVIPRFEDEGYRAARELQALMMRSRTPVQREISFGARGVAERRSTAPVYHGGTLVQRGVAFIEENAFSGITVADVVRHLNVSWRLADLRFREVTGATIQDTIVNTRLNRVKQMLAETDMRISEIALRCAYDPAVLKNLFKRRVGCSMREWRKRNS